jgi:hypothetical protein
LALLGCAGIPFLIYARLPKAHLLELFGYHKGRMRSVQEHSILARRRYNSLYLVAVFADAGPIEMQRAVCAPK